MPKSQFCHSIKVPRLYKEVSKIIKKTDTGESLKTAIFKANHPNKKGIAALAVKTLQHKSIIKKLFERSKVLQQETQMDECLAAVLVTELLWGKKELKGKSTPISKILEYKELFLKELNDPEFQKLQADCVNTVWRPRYVRVNTLKSSPEAVLDSLCKSWNLLPSPSDYESYKRLLPADVQGTNFVRDFHIKELFAFPLGTTFHDHPLYKNGSILLQDKASCMATYVLSPEPGSNVLDMCAAPGMKTTHLAAHMNNCGTIYAVEKVKSRYEQLKKQLKISNVNCVQTINCDVLKLSDDKLRNIDYILLDAPCSGSGMLSQSDLNYNDELTLTLAELKTFSNLQKTMLIHALTNFPHVKRVVYCTCSIFIEENEEVVNSAVSTVNNIFKVVNCGKNFLGWSNFGLLNYTFAPDCLRTESTEDYTNGFFIAAFDRVSS